MSIIPYDDSDICDGEIISDEGNIVPDVVPSEWDTFDPCQPTSQSRYAKIDNSANYNSDSSLIGFIVDFVKLFAVVFFVSLVIVIVGVIGGVW